jgi:hypothetical protein
MKIAQFKADPHDDYVSIFRWPDFAKDQPDYEPLKGMVRISEWVDVHFPQRPADDLVPAQIAALDAQRAQTVAEFTEKLRDIEDKRACLLAISHQSYDYAPAEAASR